MFLEGSWCGKGTVFVHDKQIPYKECSNFKAIKTTPQCTVVNYQQFTKHAETENPMHAENGFLKVFTDGKAQVALSHPFGMNEFEMGEWTDDKLTLVADQEHHF